jgi:hypothetical protein
MRVQVSQVNQPIPSSFPGIKSLALIAMRMWSDKKKATQGCGSKKILNQLQAHDTLVAALVRNSQLLAAFPATRRQYSPSFSG